MKSHILSHTSSIARQKQWLRAMLIMGSALVAMHLQAREIIDVDHVGLQVRLGYNIGGTAPIPMPAGIRHLNSYTLQPNPSFGVDITHNVTERIGVLFGIHYENKGMNEDARVKGYHEEIVRGNERLAGVFTGNVTTKVRQWMLTVPIQASYNVSDKVVLRFGPYLSLLTDKSFTGYAHGGYLRQGDPTGPKVVLGDTRETRGDYDFSANMRGLQWGLDLGADWYVYKRWGVYADLTWGLSGVHERGFKTIEQTLYPIFGTLGITYNIKYKK